MPRHRMPSSVPQDDGAGQTRHQLFVPACIQHRDNCPRLHLRLKLPLHYRPLRSRLCQRGSRGTECGTDVTGRVSVAAWIRGQCKDGTELFTTGAIAGRHYRRLHGRIYRVRLCRALGFFCVPCRLTCPGHERSFRCPSHYRPFWGLPSHWLNAADRYGSARALPGAIFAASGFFCVVPSLTRRSSSHRVIVGIGTGACSFPVVIIALGKVVSARQRSLVLGSARQRHQQACLSPTAFAIPACEWRLGNGHTCDCVRLSDHPALPLFYRPGIHAVRKSNHTAGILPAIRLAFTDQAYLLLFFGFFVCGFHVNFIQTHLPAYIVDSGLAVVVGGWSLALIGLFNIAGSFLSGWSGQVRAEKECLPAFMARGRLSF